MATWWRKAMKMRAKNGGLIPALPSGVNFGGQRTVKHSWERKRKLWPRTWRHSGIRRQNLDNKSRRMPTGCGTSALILGRKRTTDWYGPRNWRGLEHASGLLAHEGTWEEFGANFEEVCGGLGVRFPAVAVQR